MKTSSSSTLLSNKYRDTTLDILKGTGIIFVVLGHIYQGYGQNLIYLFHMPLFFFASGAVLSFSDTKNMQFTKRVKHLLVPYLFFSIVSFLYWWQVELRLRPSDTGYNIFSGALGSVPPIGQQFINIFLVVGGGNSFIYNTVLWFLPCMFCCIVLYSCLRNLKYYYSFVLIIILSSIYWVFRDQGIEALPFCVGLSFLYLPFLILGEYSYKLFRQARENKLGMLGGVITVLILLIVVSLTCGDLRNYHMMGHSYGSWWNFYLIASSLIVSVLIVCDFISKSKSSFLSWLGKNSLIIMCLHGPVYRIVLKISSIISGYEILVIRDSLLLSIVLSLVTIIILLPIIFFINKKIPFVLGNF